MSTPRAAGAPAIWSNTATPGSCSIIPRKSTPSNTSVVSSVEARGGDRHMIARQCAGLLVLVVLCTTGVACKDSRASKNPPAAALQLRGAGATFPAPLYKKWLEEYTR